MIWIHKDKGKYRGHDSLNVKNQEKSELNVPNSHSTEHPLKKGARQVEKEGQGYYFLPSDHLCSKPWISWTTNSRVKISSN